MAKISDMTAATAVADADIIPIVQSSTNKKATAALLRGQQTTNGSITTTTTETTTANATPATVGSTIALDSETVTRIQVSAECIKNGATISRTFLCERILLNNGGTITASTQVELAGPYDVVAVGSAMSTTDVNVEYTGTTARVEITGLAATNLRWLVTTTVTKLAAQAASSPAYDPAVLSLTGWWRAGDYDAGTGTWTGTASAGGSGARNLTGATNRPAAGAALNTHDTVEFVRANSDMLTGAAWTNLFAVSAYSGWVLLYAYPWLTNNANPNLTDGLLSETSGTWGIGGRTTGPAVTMQHDDGAQKRAASNMSTGAWHLIQFRHSTANGFIEIRIDNGAWVTTAAGDAGAGTGNFQIGCEYVASLFYDGLIADIGTTNSRLDDTTFDNIRAYANDRYAVAV